MPNGYKIRGIAPPDLAGHPASVRKLYWTWVVEYGIRRKDLELSRGLDKDGNPLKPITPETRSNRRSAMTPSGKGDPAAPPLTPAYHKSRTRSLLAGRALSTHAEFYWRFDAWTGASWAEVLTHQIGQGRDVFGLSAAGTKWVQSRALGRWERWKAGQYRDQETEATAAIGPAKIPAPGSFDFRHATFGAGLGHGTSSATLAPGSFSGGMTIDAWEAHFRAPSRAAVPHRPAPKAPPHPTTGPGNNVLLAHVWAKAPRPGPPTPGSAPAPGPNPKAGPSPLNRRAAAADHSRKPSGRIRYEYPDDTRGDVLDLASDIAGKAVGEPALAALAGASGPARITVAAINEASISIVARAARVTRMVRLSRAADETVQLYIANVKTPRRRQQQGLGWKAFETQLVEADKLSVDRIHLLAARDDDFGVVGYKVWPKFGFDAELPARVRETLPADLAGAARLSDLLETEAGRAWWDGHGISIPLEFGMAPDSLSRRIWTAYLARKKGS